MTRLKVVATKIDDGFFVPSPPGVKALGGNAPTVSTVHVKGWEFDNHYRVKDPKIIRGLSFDAEVLSKSPVLPKYVVDDKDYI